MSTDDERTGQSARQVAGLDDVTRTYRYLRVSVVVLALAENWRAEAVAEQAASGEEVATT